jgi:hypothetical protein
VPLSAIIVGETIQNARVRRDEEQALRSSVAEDGIDTPVCLVEDEIRPGKYHLVFGEGRVGAARDVGLVHRQLPLKVGTSNFTPMAHVYVSRPAVNNSDADRLVIAPGVAPRRHPERSARR